MDHMIYGTIQLGQFWILIHIPQKILFSFSDLKISKIIFPSTGPFKTANQTARGKH